MDHALDFILICRDNCQMNYEEVECHFLCWMRELSLQLSCAEIPGSSGQARLEGVVSAREEAVEEGLFPHTSPHARTCLDGNGSLVRICMTGHRIAYRRTHLRYSR